MKYHLRDTFATDWLSLSAWRIVLQVNIALTNWLIFVYRYQLQHGPSVRLVDYIAELEGESVRMQMELFIL